MVKTNYTSGGFSSQGHRVKGSEIFVGGFPRSVTESIIHELFSPYGEIIELRMIKDQEGNSKGFCFVRFTTKEAAFRAYKENDGVMVHGKSIRVALSSDQDSLFFGNLHKDWSLEEFDKLVRQAFKDVLSVNLAMYPSAEDFAAGKRRLNRGFAFVQFSSHAAAARAYRIGSKADFLLAGKWHPVIDWAEKEPEIDPEELSKIKAAFIGNLPNDADEEYLKKLFDPLGKVERVALSRKGHFPVGFVHFAKRSDLDNAIKEMDGKIVQGPRRGPKFKIQVAVARPVEMGKRPRDEPKNKPLPRSRDQSDSSYDGHISDSLDHKSKEPRLADQVPDTIDPYEAAVITLPAVVKEHLLQVLRVGIATRYDLNLRCITSLRELSESAAIAVLDQFMLSGADRQDKGAYFASLVSKHQAEKFGQRGSTSYEPQKTRKMFSLGARLCSEVIDLPKESELLSLGAQLCSEEIDHSASRNRLSPALFPSSSSSSLYDRTLPSRSSVRKLEDITPSYRVPASSMRYGPGIGSSSHLTPKEHPVERRQMKFDPFTGEPYKYDPFTGEPIKPEPHGRRSESFF